MNGKLRFLFNTETFYFPVNVQDDDGKLVNLINDDGCYARLRKELPDLRLVVINIGNGPSPLLVNDNELEGELLGFLELGPK